MSAAFKTVLAALVAGALPACRAALDVGSNCAEAACGRAPQDSAPPCGADFVVPQAQAFATQELYRCQLFTLQELDAPEGRLGAYITKAVATPVPYSHEIDVRIAAEVPGVADGAVDCNQILSRPLGWVPLIESSGARNEWDFESAPLVVSRSSRLLIAERFANLSADTVSVGVALHLECASVPPPRPSQVFEFTARTSRLIPPGERVTVSASCSFPREVTVWRLYRPGPRVRGFTAWRSGQTEPLWGNDANLSVDLAPSLHLRAGEGFSWECVHENDGTTAYQVGGDSGDECALMGIYQLAHEGEDAEPLRCPR